VLSVAREVGGRPVAYLIGLDESPMRAQLDADTFALPPFG
jgi:hypothetical protein